MSDQTQSVAEKGKQVPAVIRQYHKFREQGFNMLMPSATVLEGISPYHQASLDVVVVNTDPKFKEVYNTGSDESPQLGLSKPVVLRMATAAGITTDVAATCRLDDGKDPNYYRFKATVKLPKPDGSTVVFTTEKELRLDLIEQKVLAQKKAAAEAMRRKGKSWATEEWAEGKAKQDMLQIREHAASLCETKAKLRAIREALGLKTSYLPEELQNPFVVLRVTPKLDYNDPMVKQMVTAAALGATNLMYGPQAGGGSANAANETVIDVTPTDSDGEDECVLADYVVPDAPPAPPESAPVVVNCEFCEKPLSPEEVADMKHGAPRAHQSCFDAAHEGRLAL